MNCPNGCQNPCNAWKKQRSLLGRGSHELNCLGKRTTEVTYGPWKNWRPKMLPRMVTLQAGHPLQTAECAPADYQVP